VDISVKVQHGDVPSSPFFISDIVVTTLDQFLYGFARVSKQVGYHIDMPAGAIASSFVVFDEAHMYRDEFTFSIMRALIEILYKSNVPFVIMTATMPKSLEETLFENIKNYYRVESDIRVSGSIEWKLIGENIYADGEVNIPDEIWEKMKSKKTLIVVNQVKKAQEIYREVKARLELDDEQIILLHSRFTKADRTEHERGALSLIPHRENGRIKRVEGIGVVVSTQVLEAGIDFSAELLLTEVAPADALIQRVGRCARYESEKGEVVIFTVDEHKPYKKKCIESTLDWLNANPQFNWRDFPDVCRFVDETLDYKANDYEARDTLVDLYECVLYADQEPRNIQVRDGKPAQIVVVEPVVSSKREKREAQLLNGIKQLMREKKLSDSSFDVDIKIVWSWFKEGLIQYELVWQYDEDAKKMRPNVVNILERGAGEPSAEDPRISPFSTYILENHNYNSKIGVKRDGAIFV